VYDVDMFGEPNFIGQYTVPVKCLRTGYRSVPLKNNFFEDIELCGMILKFQRRKNYF
jgi:phosphatidylinositol phospholipase C gamma-1